MKKALIILAIVVNCTLLIDNCQSQWVPTYGTTISDKAITSLAVIGNKIFAGTANTGGVFSSIDNGVSWQYAGLSNNDYVEFLAVVGTNLFAYASNYNSGTLQIFRSTNYGVNWTPVGWANTFIDALYSNGSNLYAGNQIGIHVTSNNGVNWTDISNNLPLNPEVYDIRVLGPYLFAGTRYGIFRSSNNGANWTATSISSWTLSFAANGTNLFAGGWNWIILSTDYGDTWNNISNGLPDSPVRHLFSNGTNIFAANDSSVYRSTNNGGNWTTIKRGLKNPKAYSFANIGTNIFAGFSNYPNGGGVYLTTNNGDLWTLPDFAVQGINCFASKGNNIFAVSGYEGNSCNGIFLSSNNGNNWISVNNGLPNLDVRSVASNDTNIYAGTYGNGVFLSSNNGGNWSAVNTGLSNLYIRSIAVNGTNIFAGTDSAGVFLSTNNGGNWSAVNNGLTIKPIRCLGVNGSNIFAGSDSGRVYLSTNNGGIWTLVNNGISNNVIVVCFAFSENIIYTGTNGGTNGGIYVSTNSGLNWTLLRGSEVNSITTSGTDIIIGTYIGVFLSSNNGITWQNKNQGIQYSYPIVYSLLIKNTYAFLGLGNYNILIGISYNSIWRRELWELLDVKNISSVTPLSYSLSQNYPNPFNPTTKIKFDVMRLGDVKIIVYDITGRQVQTLVNETLKPGTYETTFDASALATGIYFYQLFADGIAVQTRKMILLK